jgi:hypothetical protein
MQAFQFAMLHETISLRFVSLRSLRAASKASPGHENKGVEKRVPFLDADLREWTSKRAR